MPPASWERVSSPAECRASAPYKQAIIDAGEDDIVLSERITGIPVSVIKTDFVRRSGTRAGSLCALDAGGQAHQALDAYVLRIEVDLAIETLVIERERRTGLLAGRQKRRRDRHDIQSCDEIMQQLMKGDR